MDTLTAKVFGKPYADKSYISQTLFGRVWNDGIHIVTGLPSNMKQRLMSIYDKIILRKRSIIEFLNDMLKNVVQLVHTLHRSVHNFFDEPVMGNGSILLLCGLRSRSQADNSLFGNNHLQDKNIR